MAIILDGNKILVFELSSGIGDMIMAIPMLKLLHKKVPDADITFIVPFEGARQLFETCPYISRVIKIEREGHNLVKKNLKLLQRYRYDYEFDLCIITCITDYLPLGLDIAISRSIKAKRRIGYSLPKTKFSFLPFQFMQFLLDGTIKVDFSKHYADLNVELLKLVGIYPDDSIQTLELWFTDDDFTIADRFLVENNINSSDMLIGIHPGGRRLERRWPMENFPTLIDSLQCIYSDAKFLIFGGPDEEELKHNVANLVKTTIPIIVTRMPIRSIAALIKRCNLFIGNDSSLTHIAAAVETPDVVIFGQANPLATGPYSKKSIVVTRNIDCQPCCYNKTRLFTRLTCNRVHPYECLTQLSVSEVLKAVKSLFSSLSQDITSG
ncbi:MAG: heptosyltransferase [Candidatus Poribacteria bacterium]|nr:heptosyltransferase [Candidatus Poribacteria bacterium]